MLLRFTDVVEATPHTSVGCEIFVGEFQSALGMRFKIPGRIFYPACIRKSNIL